MRTRRVRTRSLSSILNVSASINPGSERDERFPLGVVAWEYSSMPPQRARTYGWLFLAMSASVCANLLLFQPRFDSGRAPAGRDPRAMRMAPAPAAARQAEQLSDTVRALQRELKEINLYPGQIDGKPTPLVHAAIVAYE